MLEMSLFELILLCLKLCIAIVCSLIIIGIPLCIIRYIYEEIRFNWSCNQLAKLFKKDDDNDT